MAYSENDELIETYAYEEDNDVSEYDDVIDCSENDCKEKKCFHVCFRLLLRLIFYTRCLRLNCFRGLYHRSATETKAFENHG